MKNILIDTCSLIDLLSEDKNKLLPHIEFWKQNNCINLVTHKIIIEEWNKHKDKQKKRFEDSLKTKYKHTVEISRKEKLIVPEDLAPNLDNIDNQIQRIDKLLMDATQLDTSADIKIFCSDRSIRDSITEKRKAPFHNKADSTKDAYIIFSALKHFSEINEDFLFISANTDDFGSPQNLKTKIHPEIIENYLNINVQYISDIGRAINFLKSELTISLLPEEINNIITKSNEIEIYIDKTKPIVEQIHNYLSSRYKEISFFPISLLINHYPLKLDSFSNYSAFNLNTDNKELYEFFKSVEITETNEINIKEPKFSDGIADFNTKVKYILSKLTHNLIFHISNKKIGERINIRYSEEKSCDCPKCSFNKFKFTDCFQNLNIYYKNSKEDLQQNSFLNYQIGNYLFAVEKQKKAILKYRKKQMKTLTFVGQFNLSKLSIFIHNNYFGEKAEDKLFQELKSIDLDSEKTNLSTKENKNLLKFLHENNFYSEARSNIHERSRKLIDQYYSSLNGGWSSNNEVWSLISDFANLEAFLVNNFIVYNKFKEFQDIFSILLEGLFASHGTTDLNNSRLNSFDDWLIMKMLEYGNAEMINKYYRRYKIKKIHYEKTSLEKDSFSELINNFFNNSDLRKAFLENCEHNNHRFWEYYNNVFENIITIVSISDLDNSLINSFLEQLIEYLKTENYLFPQTYRHINTFLYRCGEEIDKDKILSLFYLGIQNRFLHNSEFFEALSDIFEKRKLRVTISSEQFKAIKNITSNMCDLCNKKHSPSILISFFLIIENKEYREQIVNTINSKLECEFSFDLFYLATIFDIIPLNTEMLNIAIENSLPAKNQVSLKSVFSGVSDNRFEKINSVLNLCFKFNIDTTGEQFQKFKNLDPYYSWLIDMENFNYDFFDYNWIGEYTTRFYFKKIHSIKILKDKLDLIIKDKYDNNLENHYLNIYVRKNWDIED